MRSSYTTGGTTVALLAARFTSPAGHLRCASSVLPSTSVVASQTSGAPAPSSPLTSRLRDFAGKPVLFLCKGRELFDSQSAGTDQPPEGSFGHLSMVGDGECGHVTALDQDHVNSALPRHLPTVFSKGLHNLAAAQRRQRCHQTATSTCCNSTVSGRPRSEQTSKQAAIASRMLARASSRVAPWLTQPGIEGHSAIQTPSSSRSNVARNFMPKI
jgi:hypothetical protein